MLNCTVLTSSPFQIVLQICMEVYFPGLANNRSLQDKVRKTCRSMGKFQSPDVCINRPVKNDDALTKLSCRSNKMAESISIL